MLTQESMENVQKTRRLFASAYGCKASRSFLIWSLSAAMSISVAPMMAEVSADVRNFGTQLVTQVKRVTGTIIDETGEPMIGVSVLVQGTYYRDGYGFGWEVCIGDSRKCYIGYFVYRI